MSIGKMFNGSRKAGSIEGRLDQYPIGRGLCLNRGPSLAEPWGFGSAHGPSRCGAPLCASRDQAAILHQASFRYAVMTAYGGRCAISRLPEPRLLDAAHIG